MVITIITSYFYCDTASYFKLVDQFRHALLEYGTMKSAIKLKGRSVLTSIEFNTITNLNISENLKSLVLVAHILESITVSRKYNQFKAFLNSERRLWHLIIPMHQMLCKLLFIAPVKVSLVYSQLYNNLFL